MDPSKRRCKATVRRTGEQCKNPPIIGANVCRMHGGASKQVRAKAAARVAKAKAEQQIMKALGSPKTRPVDPGKALTDLVTWKHAEVTWLRSIVAGFDTENTQDSGLVWGLTKHEDGLGPEGPIDKKTFEAEQNIWWKLLRAAETQLAQFSKIALDAGIQKEQLRVQQTTAAVFAGAITQILEQLKLSPEQARLVPEVVPTVLRQLPTGENQ